MTHPADERRAERLALVAGWQDTRRALARWNRDVPMILRTWAAVSALIGVALLVATWAVARFVAGPAHVAFPSFSGERSLVEATHVFGHNLLVLLMHALICVAGYMATQSVQIAADDYRGVTRWLHRAARPVTMVFVLCVTAGSFVLQAWELGHVAPQVALAYSLSVPALLGVLSLHALPELTAMFLPLGAWIVLARQRAWNDLFAASILAAAIALPVLAIATIVEEFVTPELLERLAS